MFPKDIMHDIRFSHAVRLITRKKAFRYPEEKDPSLWKRYDHEEKSGNAVRHGRTQPPPDYYGLERGQQTRHGSASVSSQAHWDSRLGTIDEASGRMVDSEKGRDVFVVDWYGPDDPEIGRNPVYILTLVLFVVLQVPTALATNFGMLLAFRFLTDFIGSPSLATGGASIGDMSRPAKRTYGLAVWGIGAVSGPMLGPLIGGFAAEAKGRWWTIWELMWLSGFTLVLLVFFLPETSSANILYRRSRRLRKLTENDKLVSEGELASIDMSFKDMAVMTLVRPFQLTFGEPIVIALDLYIAPIYGLSYVWFESFPLVFTRIYRFSLGIQGFAFLGIFVGLLLTLQPFVWYQRKYIEPKFNEDGELKPEWRLPPAFVGAFAIPICLFWFGWASRPDVHWIVPIIGTAWFAIGSLLLFNSVPKCLSDAYPEYAASVLAGNDFFRSALGAGFVNCQFPSAPEAID
ncbi:hypothetical protein S40288_04865 [Stachybotrys chartarum IBT 40288]|nr:hypothetical protein S40288_04865 [Stachybotrys chartarum IBT 40288]